MLSAHSSKSLLEQIAQLDPSHNMSVINGVPCVVANGNYGPYQFITSISIEGAFLEFSTEVLDIDDIDGALLLAAAINNTLHHKFVLQPNGRKTRLICTSSIPIQWATDNIARIKTEVAKHGKINADVSRNVTPLLSQFSHQKSIDLDQVSQLLLKALE